ncbi:hypothetical protein Tsubulata_004926 [Turnera subulata]|uniref:ATP-dependent DNA helicase n=1 Tax=Turnera subulata TaxID=218843 RepID=A0A9Q0G1S1_9ROSI|nr:hypothetical protein Tsubulata_004926 [Turnera subulata]
MKKSPLPVQSTRSGTTDNKPITGKESLVKLLRWHFGHSDFRGKQLDAIQAVLSGRDCFCLMPTGGGKSMCYQIPALAKPGIALVVCPLIALMENQVMALKEKGIAAEFLSSTQPAHVRNKIHEDLYSGKPSIRLLYVTPELIATPGFMSKLTKIHSRGLLNLIAIDEAHCISTWGHDFRPSYRKISSLRNCFPDVPILALTATAVPKVQKDVIESLSLQDPLILKSSFNRPNIYYEVRYKDLVDDAYADMSSLLKCSGSICGIVYCLERTTCDTLAAHLSKNGISCAGAGIDRKDVRIVCHFNIPKSMEAFYQESGRAGRDQQPSRSILYYGVDDRKRMEFILSSAEGKKFQSSSSQDGLSKKSLSEFNQMVEYCEGSGCRRKKILESFGEQVPASLCKKSCDACKHPNLLAKNLEELTVTCAARQRSNFSRISITSSTDTIDREQFSEFWNRDDEANHSEEDISDSDDGTETVDCLARSGLKRKLGLNAKIDFLQRAEERYYQNKNSEKQVSKLAKNVVSDTMREASKQRLLNALKQALDRLGNLNIELEVSATFLENECYKKYGKSGKTFYYSQVASTVRWLSATDSTELTNRLGTNSPSPPGNTQSKQEPLDTPSPMLERRPAESTDLPPPTSLQSEISHSASPSVSPTSTQLPPIPSFSQFLNSKKAKTGHLGSSENPSPKGLKNTR